MNLEIEQILNQAKELLKDEMSQISHKTWIEPLKIANIVDNNVILVSDNNPILIGKDTEQKHLSMTLFHKVSLSKKKKIASPLLTSGPTNVF